MEVPELELSLQDGSREDSVRFRNGPVVVGRMDECDFVVPDGRASRRHAIVERDGEAWFLRDLGSINGTYVNGLQLSEKHRIADGDAVQLGGSVIRCRLHGAPAPVPANRVDPIVDPDADAYARISRTVRVGDVGRIVNSVFGASLETIPVRAAGPPVFSADPAQQAAELTRIVGASADVLLGSADLETTQHYALDLVFDNLAVERGFLLLLDKSGELVPGTQRVRPGGDESQARISQHVAEAALNSQKSALIELLESKSSEGIACAMCAPLCRDGRVVGLLYVDRPREEGGFGKLELDVLSIIASIAGIAIHAARESKRGEASVVDRIARHVGPARMDDLDGEVPTDSPRVPIRRTSCTVLTCEVTGLFIGSTGVPADDLAGQADELLEGLTQALVAEGGTLDRYSGVGVVGFFGAPSVQEDHAQRAVRAALAMRRWIRERTDPDGARAVELRIGIESGEALVGDVGVEWRPEFTALGEPADASRTLGSAVADAGQIVIGAGTFRLVKSSYSCQPLPPTGLARRSDPGQAWLVEEPTTQDEDQPTVRMS